MCSRIECSQCKKPSYSGCGAHVEQVLRDVPPAERCRCREERAAKKAAQPPSEERGWLRRLFAG